jgi:multiple sugar transport system permease protein
MMAGALVFYVWPILSTVFLSLGKTGVFGGWTWNAGVNYAEVFGSPEVGRAMVNTLVYTGIVLLSIPLSLAIAALLQTRGLRFVGIIRVAYFLPIVTMPVAVGWIWSLIYNGDFGYLNVFLRSVGLPGNSWLTDPHTALVAISIVGVWLSLGYPVVLFIAALQGVPAELTEAAEIDGAGPVRRFVSVVVPMISPTIFFVTVLTVIGALQMFDLVFVMIGDASPVIPNTETVIYLFYRTAFVEHDQGLASAIVVVLMLVIMLLTYVQFRLQRRWVHYE